MTQTWTSDTYDASHTGATDLQNIENNFATIKSSFSGSGSPSNPVAGMTYFNTSNNNLRLRDSANAVWYGLMAGTTSTKLWIYANTAQPGWAIDATVTDRVIALKGGSQAYNVDGGNIAGSWTYIHSHPHSHTGTVNNYLRHQPGSTLTTGSGFVIASGYPAGGGKDPYPAQYVASYTTYTGATNTALTIVSDSTNNTMSAFRPGAAVGTLQYPNV